MAKEVNLLFHYQLSELGFMRCIGIMRNVFNPIYPMKPLKHSSDDLSYCKSNSGEIKVKTKDGEGSEFIISLPVV